MAQAFCTECGADVELNGWGVCPGGHPTSSYRYAHPVPQAQPSAAQAQPAADPAGPPVTAVHPDPPASPNIELAAGWHAPTGPAPWMFVAAFTLMLVVAVAVAFAAFAPRLRGPRPPAASASSSEASPTTGAPASAPVPAPVPAPPRPSVTTVPPFTGKATVRHWTTSQKRWALATSAILARTNAERHDTLAGKQRTAENIATAKVALAQAWDIGGRTELLGELEAIEGGKSRTSFESFVTALSKATPEQRAAIDEKSARDSQYAEQVYIARRYGKPARNRMVAWDLARYVYLCRQGYLAGYLSEAEAWPRIMNAARSLQRDFSSWRDFGDNYILGAKFWSEDPETVAAEQAAETFLLKNEYSPWHSLPWYMGIRGQ